MLRVVPLLFVAMLLMPVNGAHAATFAFGVGQACPTDISEGLSCAYRFNLFPAPGEILSDITLSLTLTKGIPVSDPGDTFINLSATATPDLCFAFGCPIDVAFDTTGPDQEGLPFGKNTIAVTATFLMHHLAGEPTPGALTAISPILIVRDPVPIPAALPLFASGVGGLGLFGWWRKRKAAALA